MIPMSLNNDVIKKYPNLDYSDLTKIENYIIDQIKNHNHGSQFIYNKISSELNYPIEWLQLVINGGHNGFRLSENSIQTIKNS